MPYIGRDLNRGNYLKLDDISSSFNSSTKTFNLTVGGSAFTPGSAFSILVSVGGVIQEPESAYQVNNSQITFANAPTAQDGFFCIALGTPIAIGVPGNGTVNGPQMAKPFNYDGFFYLNDANNRVGINSSIPKVALDVIGNTNISGNANISGILTASSFSGGSGGINAGVVTCTGLDVNGNGDISGNLVLGGDLTVNGTTTTLDTNLIGVDRIEVGANSSTVVGVAITQSGTADILRLYDGTSQVVTVDDTGNVGIGSAIPGALLNLASANPLIRLTDTDSNVHSTIGGEGGNLYLYTNSSGRDFIFRGTTEVARITGDGKLGIGTHTPTATLDVDGNIKASGTITGSSFVGALPITGDTNNRLITATGSGGLNGEANLTFNGTVLGLQQSSPDGINYVLDAVGGAIFTKTGTFTSNDFNKGHLTVRNTTPSQGAFLDLRAASSGGALGVIAKIGGFNTYSGMGYDGTLTFSTRHNTGNMVEKLRIDNDGRVIINNGGNGGTADVNADNFVVKNYDNSSSCGISILNADNQNSILYFGNASDAKHAEVVWSDAANLFLMGTSNSGAAIKLRSADQSDAVIIDSSQRVGVGTMSPDTLVEIGNAIGTGTANLLKLTSYTNSQNSRPALVFWNNNPNTAQAQISAKGGASYNASKLHFSVANSSRALQDRACIDEFGTFIIGPGETRRNTKGSNQHQVLLIEGTGNNSTRMSMIRSSNDDNGPEIQLIKTRGTSIGSVTKPNQNDYIGSLVFLGGDDSDLYSRAAEIAVQATGVPANDRIPSDIIFSTTPTSGATSPQESLRITSAGKLEVKGTRAGSLQANDDDALKLYTKSTNASIDRGVGITFYTHDGSGYEMGGTIQVAKETAGANNPASYMRFSTQSGSTTTERLRINSSGQMIMTNAATQTFADFSTTNNNTRGLISLAGKDSSGNAVTLKMGGFGDTNRAEIFTHSNHGLGFATNNAATQMMLSTNGNLLINQTTEFGAAIKLSVRGASSAISDGAQIFDITTTAAASGGTRLSFGVLENVYSWIRSYESGTGSRDLVFSGVAEYGRFNSSGQFSIGATNPSSGAGFLNVKPGSEDTYIKFRRAADFDSSFDGTSIDNRNSANNTNRDLIVRFGKMAMWPGGVAKIHIDTSGRVRLGTTETLHSSGENLVVGSGSGEEGMSIYSGSTSAGVINFADGNSSTERYDGRILYNHGSTPYMRFCVGQGEEKFRINSTGGIQISEVKNVSATASNTTGSFNSAELILTTPAYAEYHYTWSGHSSYTIDLTCASYFHSEFIYVQHQTNGGTGMQSYIRGKWANNHFTHTCQIHEWYGVQMGLDVTFVASDQSGNGAVNGEDGLTDGGWSNANYRGKYGGGGDNQDNTSSANGRLRITETYSWGSVSSRALIVRVYFGSFNISKS